MSVSAEDIQSRLAQMSDAEIDETERKVAELENAAQQNPLLFYKPASDIHRAFENDRSQISFLFGGNNSGKTYCGTKQLVCHLLGYDPSGATPNFRYFKPPIRAWMASVDKTKAQAIFLQDVLTKLPANEIKRYDHQKDVLYLKNGSSLKLMCYEQDVLAWQSEAIHFILCDEQPPAAHYEEAKSRILRTHGFFRCTMSPLYARSRWTYDEVILNQRGAKSVTFYTADIEDNSFASKEIKQKYYDAFKGTAEEEGRLHGRHSFLEGAIHKAFSDKHIIPYSNFPINDRTISQYKFARIIDAHPQAPIVTGWFAYQRYPKPVVYQFNEYVVKDQRASVTAKKIVEMTGNIPIQFSILDTPESTSDKVLGTNIRTEFARNGIITTTPIRNMFMGIERFNDYLESDPPSFYITENCTYSIYSIRSYMWDTWKHNPYDKAEKEKPTTKDNHAVRNVHYMMMTMPSFDQFKASIRGAFQSAGRQERYYVNPALIERRYHSGMDEYEERGY